MKLETKIDWKVLYTWVVHPQVHDRRKTNEQDKHNLSPARAFLLSEKTYSMEYLKLSNRD